MGRQTTRPLQLVPPDGGGYTGAGDDAMKRRTPTEKTHALPPAPVSGDEWRAAYLKAALHKHGDLAALIRAAVGEYAPAVRAPHCPHCRTQMRAETAVMRFGEVEVRDLPAHRCGGCGHQVGPEVSLLAALEEVVSGYPAGTVVTWPDLLAGR